MPSFRYTAYLLACRIARLSRFFQLNRNILRMSHFDWPTTVAARIPSSEAHTLPVPSPSHSTRSWMATDTDGRRKLANPCYIAYGRRLL